VKRKHWNRVYGSSILPRGITGWDCSRKRDTFGIPTNRKPFPYLYKVLHKFVFHIFSCECDSIEYLLWYWS
jgi:hypothetical protein